MPDERAEPQGADQGQQRARDQDRQKQPFETELCHRCSDEDDEGTCGSADLEPAAAEPRDGEAADDRCIKPTLRRNPGGDRDRHGERQRDDRDRQRRQQVPAEGIEAVTLVQHSDQFRPVEMGCCSSVRDFEKVNEKKKCQSSNREDAPRLSLRINT